MAIELLTERLLMDAGGWQAVKLARAFAESGRVVSAAYTPPLLKGVVREGEIEYRAGLKISSKSNIENICSCRESRQWGTICAHSLAVGFALIAPKTAVAAMVSNRDPGQPDPEKRLESRPSSGQGAGGQPVPGPQFVAEASAAGGSEFVALSVVLPPQFVAAWERGNITVGIEAERNGRRVLLNALDAKSTFRCSEADLRLIAALRLINPGALAGMLSLPKEKALLLLDGLREHPRVTFGRNVPVHIASTPVLPKLDANIDREGRLLLHVEWPTDTRLLPGASPAWSICGAVLAQVAPRLPAAYAELLRRDIMLPPDQAARFLATELPMLGNYFELSGTASSQNAPQMAPEPGSFSLTIEGSLNHLSARLQRIYSKRVVTIGVTNPDENWAIPDPSEPSRIFCRNIEAERGALSELTRFGFAGPDMTGHFVLKGERAILAFFAEGYPRLQQQWEVSLGSRFTNITAGIERISPRVEITGSGEEWFDLHFDLSTSSGERFSTTDIQRLLQLGQNHVRLRNGKMAVFSTALLDDFQSVLRDCNPEQRQPGAYRISRAQAGYLDASVAEAGFAIDAPQSWREWAQTQRGTKSPEPVALGDLEPVMRNYQKQGTAWMAFLAANRLGGLLADDMGLGKTIQALAYLRTLPGPALVVCPSSLIFNWQREVEKFTPERKLLLIEGANRAALFKEIPKADLVITSYPLLRRDAERYRQFEFTTAILDEAQHIKNPDTQNAQAAGILRAARKFILTGTPVENSVRDVWSLMNFVMPGYLGDREEFHERYEVPITRHNSKEALGRLAKRLRPFLLRRRKQEVATDLPDKLEQVAYCELTSRQREVYAALLQGARSQVEQAADKGGGGGRARMLMLTALLRLRQASCDLRLLEKDGDGAKTAHSSGKLELFGELLEEAIDGGHRILVFSQFVSMLTLIRAELETAGISYCYLDGQTKDRAAEVDRFQAGAIPVFLISLKAGGTGLNLTAADTVIHFDPWWNPAVEAQATDRAHRIGQRNVVTSYKLIARGTVEEKILNLQRKKREIIDAAIENEEPMMESLSMDEIESLIME